MAKHIQNHGHAGRFSDTEHKHAREHGGKKHITAKVKDTPGLISVERQIQDEAIVISGALSLRSKNADPSALIAEELEEAAHAVRDNGGIVGHIKAGVIVTSTCMISVTDEKADVKDAPQRRARITLAAIMFMIDPEIAENIITKALSSIRTRLKDE